MATKAQGKYVKLIMVTADNNNKYYEMTWDGKSSDFDVKYGRVESTAVTGSYPICDWEKKYNEKVRKGYKDVTQYVTEDASSNPTPSKLSKISDNTVEAFMSLMKKYTDGLVDSTYSVKATSVTQAQVDAAQAEIDAILAIKKPKQKVMKDKAEMAAYEKAVNQGLTKLYTTIPRKMVKVQSHLMPHIDLNATMIQEQANLDAMGAQVAMLKPKTDSKGKKEAKTLLDVLGITMKETKSNPEIEYLLKQIKKRSEDLKAVFEVNKPVEDAAFNKWVASAKDKSTKILIHGTKCTSVLPILEIGLKIRPSGNFQFSGKAYGDGNYFSEVVDKSMGYTGWDDDHVLLVYEVHTGNPFVYDGWYRGNSFSLTQKELAKRGYDSTYVKAGNGLLNSEIIAYSEQQNRIKYIIWLKD